MFCTQTKRGKLSLNIDEGLSVRPVIGCRKNVTMEVITMDSKASEINAEWFVCIQDRAQSGLGETEDERFIEEWRQCYSASEGPIGGSPTAVTDDNQDDFPMIILYVNAENCRRSRVKADAEENYLPVLRRMWARSRTTASMSSPQ